MIDEPETPEALADELRALLAELGAVGRDLEERPGERARGERDLAAMLASRRSHSPDSASSGRRSGRRMVVLLAAACVLAAAFVLVRPFSGSDPAYARTPAMLRLQDGGALLSEPGVAASSEFRTLAKRAADGAEPADAPVQLIARSSWLLSTDEGKGKKPASSVIVPVVSSQYFQPDGTVRTIEHRSQPLDRDGEVTEKIGQWSKAKSTSDETFDGPEMGPDYADELPLDSHALESKLIDDADACKDIRSFCLSTAVTLLHYNYVLKPDVAGALWRLLATEPGFRYLGRSEDRLGRVSMAFSTDGSDPSRRLILLADPKTGALLGSEEILVKDSKQLGLSAPAVIEFTALEESRRIEARSVPDPSLTTRY